MKTFKIIKRRTEIVKAEVEADNEIAALRQFKDEALISDREWENESTVIVELQ